MPLLQPIGQDIMTAWTAKPLPPGHARRLSESDHAIYVAHAKN
jgi:hypothetical protein